MCSFQNPIENGQHTNSTLDDVKIMNQRSHILYEQLKGFVQRMDMNVVKKDLPPKTVFVISVKLSPLQRKLYKRFLDVHGFTNDRASNEKMRKRCFFVGYQALAQVNISCYNLAYDLIGKAFSLLINYWHDMVEVVAINIVDCFKKGRKSSSLECFWKYFFLHYYFPILWFYSIEISTAIVVIGKLL